MTTRVWGLFLLVLAGSLGVSSLALAAVLPQATPPTPVAYWPFDEGQGTTANDASGNGHTGTLQGGAAWADGRFGKAVSLNGSTAYISIRDGPGLDGMTTLTIDAWVYLKAYAPSVNAQVGMVTKWGPSGPSDDSYNFSIGGDGKFFLAVSDGLSTGPTMSSRTSRTSVPLTTWARVTGTWKKPGDIHLYIDGIEVSGDYYAGVGQNTSQVNDNSQEVWIGKNVADAPGTFLNALIDEVRIYNVVLPPTTPPIPPASPTYTPTPTPTPTLTATPTPTPVPTPTPAPTPAPLPTPTTLPTPTQQPTPTQSPTSVRTPTATPIPTVISAITDQQGDWTGTNRANYLDIVSASVSDYGPDQLLFTVVVVSSVPNTPPNSLGFVWGLDLNNNGAFSEFPPDLNVRVAYDADPSHGVVFGWHGFVDGTPSVPLLSSFDISANTIRLVVPRQTLGNPKGFNWQVWIAAAGGADMAPNTGFATWPPEAVRPTPTATPLQIPSPTATPAPTPIPLSGLASVSFSFDQQRSELVVTVNSPQGIARAQIKLEIPTEISTKGYSTSGFLSNALYLTLPPEYRWVNLSANGEKTGSLNLALAVPAGKSFTIRLLGLDLKDANDNNVPVATPLPMSLLVSTTPTGSSPAVPSATPSPAPAPRPSGVTALISVEPSKQQVRPGEEFTAAVRIDPQGRGVSSGEAVIKFDIGAFEALAAQPGDLLGANALSPVLQIDNNSGQIRVVLARVGPTSVPTDRGALVLVKLKVKANAKAGKYAISIVKVGLADEAFKNIPSTVPPDTAVGVVSLTGDINGDGTVDFKDLAILGAAYGTSPGTAGWNPNADLNNDGVVDFKDLAILGSSYGQQS